MTRVSSIFNVSLPEGGAQVLRCASNGGHSTHSSILSVLKIVLRLSKVNDLHLVRLHENEQIRWLDVSMADSYRLQIAHRRNRTDYHFLQLVLLPELCGTLALAEHVFKIRPAVHVLANHRNAVRIVHSLVEVVSVELEYIWMTLHFE